MSKLGEGTDLEELEELEETEETLPASDEEQQD